MSLQEATECYQAQLEATRRAHSLMEFEIDTIDDLFELDEDLAKAKRAMEVAWLAHITS